MPQIYEMFGYPLSDSSAEADECRHAAYCPFLGTTCDGGGNRSMSHIHMVPGHPLHAFFRGQQRVASGVCSLQLREGESPWIVCPRRLLSMSRPDGPRRRYQEHAKGLILRHSGFPVGTRLGVWSEVKIKFKYANQGDVEEEEETEQAFDYTFDYVIMPLGRVAQPLIERAMEQPWLRLRRSFESGGFSLAHRRGVDYIENYPIGPPLIVEIMTSSTSGGNRVKRTCIPMAFEDAILGRNHKSPGINYRQVWARMASQLIVKSQVAMAWGGKAVWVLQDVLVDYISSTTALDIHRFLAAQTSEVNILSLSYGDSYRQPAGIIELQEANLYSGPISRREAVDEAEPCFQDIIKVGVCPPRQALVNKLVERGLRMQMTVPVFE